jgi:hypothetical protein
MRPLHVGFLSRLIGPRAGKPKRKKSENLKDYGSLVKAGLLNLLMKLL